MNVGRVRVSAVINTWNEAEKLKCCLASLNWVDEIVVVDMGSVDGSVEVAKKFGAKVYSHPYESWVEKARNFSLKKATGDWILVVDPDEEIPPNLASKLRQLAENPKGTGYFRIPRKNLIFGKWLKNSRWWPDYNIRFFKKSAVVWSEKIHSVPITSGQGLDLEAKESEAIIHYHYTSVSEYLLRNDRYTTAQAQDLLDSGYRFDYRDLLRKPVGEFLSRYFFGRGYKDGLHGLVLALLQSYCELVKLLKIWEAEKFTPTELPISLFNKEINQVIKEVHYWQDTTSLKETSNPLLRFGFRIKRRLSQGLSK